MTKKKAIQTIIDFFDCFSKKEIIEFFLKALGTQKTIKMATAIDKKYNEIKKK